MIFSVRKLAGVPKVTGRKTLPSEYALRPGTIPWKVQFECSTIDCGRPSRVKVSRYMMLMVLPPSINVLASDYVAYLWSHDEGAPPGVFDPAGVVFAAPADWLLGPVEVLSGGSGDGVDRDRSHEDLLFPAVVEPNEGVERAHFAAKSWVVIAGLLGVESPVVAVIVVAVVVPVAPYLFDLFERLSLTGRVPGREPFFAVEDARLVHSGDCVEIFYRSSSVATRGVAA